MRFTPSHMFPQPCHLNGSNVRLTDDGPLLSFQGRSSSASSFHASLLQAISGVMFLALCLQVVSQASQHFRSSEKQATCESCFARSLSARSFPFTPACPGQYTHRSFRRWMSTIDTFQSGLPRGHQSTTVTTICTVHHNTIKGQSLRCCCCFSKGNFKRVLTHRETKLNGYPS